ncbi:aminoglycoside adenylyltransferase domain-containing protein [Saccharibacillus sacchari]|uniref:aminoglycoside adenylyltransferase domain-containing protein n=1 Tax=Saccharibacillus sacchari TaxID=456493 RepID=UPI0004B593D3|nr:aminoglycoside adenylyltransferase domain-containing protein [Saccharibacillus sacchari]
MHEPSVKHRKPEALAADLRSSPRTREAFASAEELSSRCRQILGECVVGVYLHGSLAIGGFNRATSDIDLLVVTEGQPERTQLQKLTLAVRDLHRQLPEGRHIEFTVIEASALRPFVHPAPFIYHYSAAHRERYATDPEYVCGGWEDPDLAAQVAVAYERGIPLHGLPLRELYPPVPREAYVRSIRNDVSNAESEISENPVYLTLNLCRVLMFLQEGYIASKKEGGEWGTKALPEWKEVIDPLLAVYKETSRGDIEIPAAKLTAFAKEMQSRIDAAASLIETEPK